MIAFVLWIALAVLVAYLIGEAARVGAVAPACACNQNCRQGRACHCTDRADGETPP